MTLRSLSIVNIDSRKRLNFAGVNNIVLPTVNNNREVCYE